MRKTVRVVAVCALMALPGAWAAGGRFDGSWMTHLACVAHGETPGYKWEFPATIMDGNFLGQHSQQGMPGYLVIKGKIGDDGTAKLDANGENLTQNHAHGIFALKGDKYSYKIDAQFMDTKGTGNREAGAGVLGRDCTFEFDKQPDAGAAPSAAPAPVPAQ